MNWRLKNAGRRGRTGEFNAARGQRGISDMADEKHVGWNSAQRWCLMIVVALGVLLEIAEAAGLPA